MENYDVLVIGAGLGGLACAALLAQGGKKVLVVEKRSRVGGRSTTRFADGMTVDYGLHLMAAGGHIERLLTKIGSKIKYVYTDPLYYFHDDDKIFGIPNRLSDYQNFEYIPATERKECIDILETIREMPFEEIENYDSMPFKDWLTKATSSEAIRKTLTVIADALFTQSNPRDISTGAVFRCFRQALKSDNYWNAYPEKGGFIAISLALADVVEKCGGKVLTDTAVREISVRNGKVVQVIAENSDSILKIKAPIVVSNLPIVDIFSLVPSDIFPRWFVERIHLLERNLHQWPSATFGASFVANKPLHNLKSIIAIPPFSPANKVGPSYIRWVGSMSNINPSVCPPDVHVFTYGYTIPRAYADYLRDMGESVYLKNAENLTEELWEIFPDYDQSAVIRSSPGLGRATDWGMQFPGNSWRQRVDVKAPAVDGLYFVGDMVLGWGQATDLATHSGILCAERILKTA